MSTTPYSSRELEAQGASMGAYFQELLTGAESYDRIAGYFSFSILDAVGEAFDSVSGKIRILCNAELSGIDVALARRENDSIRLDAALQAEWNQSIAPLLERNAELKLRAQRAAAYLKSGKLEVRVLGSDKYGLIHAKTGVIRYPHKASEAFCGSVNETKSAMQRNYEAVWVSSEERLVAWANAEFECLWVDGVPLSEALIEHIRITANRQYLPHVKAWRDTLLAPPSDDNGTLLAPFVDMPLMQGEGFWPHQLYFLKLAFDYHTYDDRAPALANSRPRTAARLILADQVGLGKTIQLIAFAVLVSLYSAQPVLILVPASLRVQWFNEIRTKFAIPVAYWDDTGWVSESGSREPKKYDLMRWPRRIGIVSTGILDEDNAKAKQMLRKNYGAVLVDEAHKTSADYHKSRAADKTRAYQVLEQIAENSYGAEAVTKSLILATATPMQLKGSDSWALLALLGKGPYGLHVLGRDGSHWRDADLAEALVIRKKVPAKELDDHERWNWFSNPAVHPVARSGIFERDLGILVNRVGANLWKGDSYAPDMHDYRLLQQCFDSYRKYHNPLIEHTVFRTRTFLENKLPKIRLELFGDKDVEAIEVEPVLQGVFDLVKEFCREYGKTKGLNAFMETFLSRRVGSSLYAAKESVRRMLDKHSIAEDDEAEDALEITAQLSPRALEILRELNQLFNAGIADPKYAKLLQVLKEDRWDQDSVLFFSEHYDTVWDTARRLSIDYPATPVVVYSTDSKSGRFLNGEFCHEKREVLKQSAEEGKYRFMLATKAGQEGLNLQAFGRLINIDLPWNPAHLEQRKGRIQRLGQRRQVLYVYNLRYAKSVEDEVYQRIAERLKKMLEIYGVVPDTIDESNFDESLIADSATNPFKRKYEVERKTSLKGVGFHALGLEQVRAELAKDS